VYAFCLADEHMHVQVQQLSALVAYQLQMENQQLVYHTG
jgi:hypothetical protein